MWFEKKEFFYVYLQQSIVEYRIYVNALSRVLCRVPFNMFLFVTIFQVCSSGWNLSYEHFREFYTCNDLKLNQELFIYLLKGYQNQSSIDVVINNSNATQIDMT